MSLSWVQIHELEVRENYPAAIDALEERLRAYPSEPEAVIRLGFNLWYATVEDMRLGKGLPIAQYASRFMKLLREYQSQFESNPDFCWAFGLGLSMFWYEFPGGRQEVGDALIERAKVLDSFYARFGQVDVLQEAKSRFFGRGIFESYYALAEPCAPPNGGPAPPHGNSGATEGPPSVS